MNEKITGKELTKAFILAGVFLPLFGAFAWGIGALIYLGFGG